VLSLAVYADESVTAASRADLVDIRQHARPSHKINGGFVKKTPTSEALSRRAPASAGLMRRERESDQSALFDHAKTIGASSVYDADGEDEEPSGEEAPIEEDPPRVSATDDEGEEIGEEVPLAPRVVADDEGEETGEEAPVAPPVAADGEDEDEIGEDETTALNKEAVHHVTNKQFEEVHTAANQLSKRSTRSSDHEQTSSKSTNAARRKLEQGGDEGEEPSGDGMPGQPSDVNAADDEGEETGEEAPVAPPVTTDDEGEDTGEEAPVAPPVTTDDEGEDTGEEAPVPPPAAADGEDEDAEIGEDETTALEKTEATQEVDTNLRERHLAADLASRSRPKIIKQGDAPHELALESRDSQHELEQTASDDDGEGEEGPEDQEPYEVSNTKTHETTSGSGSTQKADNADPKVEDVRRREEQEERAHAEHGQK
jgi:hypothetical protein